MLSLLSSLVDWREVLAMFVNCGFRQSVIDSGVCVLFKRITYIVAEGKTMALRCPVFATELINIILLA